MHRKCVVRDVDANEAIYQGTSVMIEEVNSQINSVMNSLSTRLEGGTSRNHGCGYMPLEVSSVVE